MVILRVAVRYLLSAFAFSPLADSRSDISCVGEYRTDFRVRLGIHPESGKRKADSALAHPRQLAYRFLDASFGAQGSGLVGGFPGRVDVVAAKVTVGGGRLVDRAAQFE